MACALQGGLRALRCDARVVRLAMTVMTVMVVVCMRIILPPVAPSDLQASSIHERSCFALDGIGYYSILNTWYYPDVGNAGIVGAMRHKSDDVTFVKYVCITGSDALQLVDMLVYSGQLSQRRHPRR
jgi:hypothetical protein